MKATASFPSMYLDPLHRQTTVLLHWILGRLVIPFSFHCLRNIIPPSDSLGDSLENRVLDAFYDQG